ncbi:MAG TPA: hypothetical protein VKB30_04190, partial [Candidatus Limnocylindrales bacterium]|nr:hypothetical protein [Candidatus Limnocylindrales bacterium]
MKRLLATLALATVALAAAACGSTNAGGPAPSAGPADPDAPAITASNLKFDQAEVVVTADTPLKLTFTNNESAPHN